MKNTKKYNKQTTDKQSYSVALCVCKPTPIET